MINFYILNNYVIISSKGENNNMYGDREIRLNCGDYTFERMINERCMANIIMAVNTKDIWDALPPETQRNTLLLIKGYIEGSVNRAIKTGAEGTYLPREEYRQLKESAEAFDQQRKLI